MFPSDVTFLVAHEQIQDRLIEAAHERILHKIRYRSIPSDSLPRKAVDWLSSQLVSWSCLLPGRANAPVCVELSAG